MVNGLSICFSLEISYMDWYLWNDSVSDINIDCFKHTECRWTFCGFEEDNPHEVETFSQIWNSLIGLNFIGLLLLFSIYMTWIIVNADLAMIVLWFTPSHLGISDILGSFSDWVVTQIESNFNLGLLLIFVLIIYIVMLLACFIYTEIIIVKICGCDKNIETKFSERGLNESSETTYQNEISLLVLNEHEKEEGLEQS